MYMEKEKSKILRKADEAYAKELEQYKINELIKLKKIAVYYEKDHKEKMEKIEERMHEIESLKDLPIPTEMNIGI